MKQLIWFVLALTFTALEAGSSEVKTETGKSPAYYVGTDIKINPKSTLRHKFVAIVDNSPIELAGVPHLRAKITAHGAAYTSNTKVTAKDTVLAFEIRFVVLNVFGDIVKTLSATEVEDISPGTQRSYNWSWDARWNEIEEYHVSIAYVSRCVTPNGRMYVADMDNLLEIILEWSPKTTKEGLISSIKSSSRQH